MRVRELASLPILVLLIAACGIPRDADGTLRRARGGPMRVGFAVDTPWVTDSAGEPGGIEPALVRATASRLRSKITWRHGAESELLEQLHSRELDVVIAGLTATSPWKQQVALTLPYYTDTVLGAHGKLRPEPHVVAAAPGENAWLMELEKTLIDARPALERGLRPKIH